MHGVNLGLIFMIFAIALQSQLSNNVFSGLFSLGAAGTAFISGLALAAPGSLAIASVAGVAALAAAAISFFSEGKRKFYFAAAVYVVFMAWYLYLTRGV